MSDTPPTLRFPRQLPGSRFTLADTIQSYTKENLYVKIDGHDVAFFRFGFVTLFFASYAGGSGAVLDVYAYRMDRRENALGIYAAERSDIRETLTIAEAGYESGGAAFFYRGPWYVQIIPSGDPDALAGARQEIIDSLDRLLPSPSAPLTGLTWFPSTDRIENSDGYFPDNAFGVDFVGDVFTAEYQLGGEKITAFCHQSDSAAAMHDRYREFLANNAKPQGETVINGVEVSQYLDYGEHVWIFTTGDSFVGLTGSATPEQLKELAGDMVVAAARKPAE